MRSRTIRTLAAVAVGIAGLAVSTSSPVAAADGAIKGLITNGLGNPFPTAHAYATTVDGTITDETTADAMGAYTLTVPPGTYCVSFGPEPFDSVTTTSYSGARHCRDGATPVIVGSGLTVTGVDATLHLGGWTGKVFDAAAAPVVGATVYAVQVGGTGAGQAATNATGTYFLKDLPPGIYCVSPVGPDGAQLAGGPPACRPGAVRKTVKPDETEVGVDFTLGAPPTLALGGVSGRVTANGLPLANRPVVAFRLDTNGERSTLTAADGSYSITNVDPGSYCVYTTVYSALALGAEAYDNKDSCDVATPVVVGTSVVPNIDLALDQGGAIAGSVTVSGGVPYASALVIAQSFGDESDFTWRAEKMTGPGGLYEITGLPAGQFCVTVLDAVALPMWATESYSNAASCALGATPVVVTRGATTSVDVELSAGGSISGTVTVPAGHDVTKISITASGPQGSSQTVQPDALGNYSIQRLTPGSHCVRFSPPADSDLVETVAGTPTGTCRSSSPRGIMVTEGAATDVDASVPLGGSVSGWAITSLGTPIADANVSVRPPGLAADDDRQFGRLDRVRADGSFWIRGIPAGTYCLMIAPSGYGIGALQTSASTSCEGTAGELTIGSGQNVANVLITPPVVGYVGMTISYPAGHSAEGSQVDLYAPGATTPTRTSIIPEYGLPSPMFTSVEAPPGTYCVLITPTVESGLAPRAFSSAAACGSQAQSVTVTANEVTGIDMTLELLPTPPPSTGPVYIPLAEPRRLLDTRAGFATVDGVDAGGGVVELGGVREVQVAGRAGVPGSAASVVLNVTAVDATAPGFMTVWPCGVPRPLASNVNFAAGQTIPNSVIAKAGKDGKVCLFASQQIDAVVDVAGYFAE